MGASFFSNPTDYEVVDEGGDGSGFYDGPAYTAIDPVAINDSVAEAAASATASEASKLASGVSATASAASASASATSAAAALVSQNAAAASATAADASDDNAVAQATIATTKASEAATSAAAALVSEGNAASSASAASTSASNASTSASNASTSETNAAASAAAALVSETNAAAAVQAAKGTATPLMDGSAAVGAGTKWAREDHVHPTDTSRAPLASPALTGTPTAPTPSAADNSTKIATTAYVDGAVSGAGVASIDGLTGAFTTDDSLTAASNVLRAQFKGHLYGLTLSNNSTDATNDIDIAVGEAAADGTLMVLSSGLTKRLDAAWAVGTNQGGLDTGAIADTSYHVWLIQRSDTGVVDALFSASATSPTMPANYDRKRRIGAILRRSGAILAFTQTGDFFQLGTPVSDASGVTPGSTAPFLVTLTVPTGVVVRTLLNVHIVYATSASNIAWGPPSVTLVANNASSQSFSSSTVNPHKVTLEIFTDTSGQIKGQFSAVGPNYAIGTAGWTDTRGRLS